MKQPRRRFGPAWALLLALLASQSAIVLIYRGHELITDEHYYVEKARYINEHHAFAPIDPHARAVERGEAYGTSDWRPPGYAIVLAVLAHGDFHDPAVVLRSRVTIAHTAMVVATLIAFYAAAVAAGAPAFATALLLGIPPWTFFVANEIGPDPESLFLAGFALLLLWRFVVAERHATEWLAAATFLSTLAFFFRPEMIVLPPLLVGLALALRRRDLLRSVVIAGAVFGALVGAQVAYRTSVTGKVGLFGSLRLFNRGAFDWANTWFGTEKETYDFVYAISEGRAAALPERAFDDPGERARVKLLVAGIIARGGYTETDDRAFAHIAEEKRRAHPLRMVLLRAWHAIHLWVNLETNSPLLDLLSPVPRPVRRPIYGALLVVRLVTLMLAGVALVRVVRELRKGGADRYSYLVAILLFYAGAQTLLIAGILDWNVHRYVLSAWPPLLCCSAIALRRGPRP